MFKFSILILTLAFGGLSACANLKTRQEVAQEAQAAAEEEQPAPIDDQVLDDSLAELGIDPEGEEATTPDAEAAPAEATSVAKKKKKPAARRR